VRAQIGVPVLTDVHEQDIAAVAAVVDVLQTPAFLCRQTDFIQAVAAAGKPVNIKKGQFLAPWRHEARGRQGAGCRRRRHDHGLRARRFSFGYNNLVSDMRSLAIMRETGCPVVFDATHSVQLPGGQGTAPAASASSCRCWRGRRWPRASPACSWKPIPPGPWRCPMGRSQRSARLRGLPALAQAAVAHYGGRYLVRGGGRVRKVLEGGWQPQRLVILDSIPRTGEALL
jgi:hypothetical protein